MSIEPARVLAQLEALPAEERASRLRVSPLDGRGVAVLAEAVEQMALSEVGRALEASAVLLEAAKALGGAAALSDAWRARAQSLAYAGRFEEALPQYDEALSSARRADDASRAAAAQLAMIHALVHLGRFDEALAAGEAARAAFAAAGDPRRAARAECSLGGVHQKRDDPAAALACFQRARPWLEDDPVARAQLDTNRGLALLALHEFSAAQRAYEAALPVFEASGLAWAAAIVEGNLAELAGRQGLLQRALRHVERTRRHLERDAAPIELARVSVEQAETLLTLGCAREAAAQLEAALPLLRSQGLALETAQALAALGRARWLLDDPQAAEPILLEASDAYGRLEQIAAQARIDLLLAQLAAGSGRLAQARHLATAAAAALGDRPADAAAAHYHLARIDLDECRPGAALSEIERGLRLSEPLGIGPLLADLLHVRARARAASGEGAAALVDYRAAVIHAERVRGALQAERFRLAFHGGRVAMFEDWATLALNVASASGGGDSAGAATGQVARRLTGDAARDAFEAIERAKSRVLLERVGDEATAASIADEAPAVEGVDAVEADMERRLARATAEVNALYSALADAHREAGAATRLVDLRQEIESRQQLIETLEGRLATTRGDGELRAGPVALADVQAALRPDAALIEYFATPREVLALVLRRDGVCAARRLCEPAQVEAQVRRVQFQMRRALRPGACDGAGGARLLDDARRELGALHNLILAPLGEALSDVRRLVVVPHGPLHATPWAALWDGRRSLGERCELIVAPSASLWLRLRARPQVEVDAMRVLIVGAADDAAPDIEREARTLAAELPRASVLLGAQATAERVLAAASQADVIHLACHGHYSADNPLGSGLRLADRWLPAQELAAARWRAGLVTLSGCETGLASVSAGDELMGLLRAFLSAGAGRLLVSLWSVNDESTTGLMSRFYRAMRQTGDPRGAAAALRQAMLATADERPHPAFWAPFILVGGE